MRSSSLAVLLLAGALLAGCLKPDPVPRFTPAWEPFDPTEPGWLTTKQALVMADCQLHNLYSKAVPERNLSAEAAVATAIRSPQLDLFSRDVLAWILANGAPDADLVLHLGDALDLACEGELEAFIEVMDAGPKPWFMAPGNHDCFYFGIYDPQHIQLWDNACYESGRPLSKDLFIRLYLAALARRDDPDSAAFAEVLGLTAFLGEPLAELAERIPASFAWERPVGESLNLEAVWWTLDPERPWRSFLVQSIDLTKEGLREEMPARVMLLDSCQYERRPEMIPNAWRSYPVSLNSGSTGEMLPDQLRIVRSWIERTSGGSLAFHHPFDALAPRARASIGWLRRERPANTLFTAHTHRGYYAHHDLGGEFDELELNLASTTDWPMEWRLLSGYLNLEERKAYLRAARKTLVEELSHEKGFFLRGWEIPLDAPDDYRRYKQGQPSKALFVDYYIAFHLVPYWLPQPRIRPTQAARRTEEQVKDTLLWTYLRLISDFPTNPSAEGAVWPGRSTTDRRVSDRILTVVTKESALEEKVAFLRELELFERTRSSWDPASGKSTDDVRVRYKISQAAWASRYEKQRGRQLSVEDDLIHLDWDKMMGRRQRMGLETLE